MKKEEPKDVESTPEESVTTDWREALDHAVKATREAFNAAAEATAEVLRQGGKLAEKSMGEAQRTLVITLDDEILEALDKLVAAGIHKSRPDALRHLLKQGMHASGDLLSRIDKVETEIEELRAKMREIPIEGAE